LRLTNERDGSLYRAQHAANNRALYDCENCCRYSDSRNKFWHAKRNELRKVEGIGSEVADQISNWESIVDLGAELDRIREFGAAVITQESPSYPKSLREIHAPPIVLYVWGELQERDHHAIGIIGARRTTHYGSNPQKSSHISSPMRD
jgi:DNA processing protein